MALKSNTVAYSDAAPKITYESNGLVKKYAWMRVLTVTLTSYKTKQKMVFGNADTNLDMVISGYKYMSALKDTCTIKISNLTYKEMISIIQDEYYLVEVKCGYQQGNVFTIFKGGVLYVSNSLSDNKTNECVIICGSELVARFSQQRLNLSFNSGINMYSALNFICKMSGIPNANISTEYKKRLITDIVNCNGKTANIVEGLADDNSDMLVTSDSSDGSILSIYDVLNGSHRVIELNSSTIDLSGGYPQLNTSGLTLTVMPTILFKPTDIIKIDNSIIDVSITQQSQIAKQYANYLDKDGMYTVYDIQYTLENNGSRFSMTLNCKSISLLEGITGTASSATQSSYYANYGKGNASNKDRSNLIN